MNIVIKPKIPLILASGDELLMEESSLTSMVVGNVLGNCANKKANRNID